MENNGLLFYYITTITSFAFLVASLIIGFLKYVFFSKEQKWYFYYIGFVFIIELTTKTLLFVGIENLFVYPFYISGEFLILMIMFIKALKLNRRFYILIAIITGLLFAETTKLWILNENVTSGVGKLFSHIIIVCTVGYYLINELVNLEVGKQKTFLIISGFLFLYYLVSIFFFLFMNQLTTISNYNASILWGMNNLFSSILYGASFYIFLISKR